MDMVGKPPVGGYMADERGAASGGQGDPSTNLVNGEAVAKTVSHFILDGISWLVDQAERVDLLDHLDGFFLK